MRPALLAAACVLILAACSPQAPDGSTAPPPADAPPAAAPPAPAAPPVVPTDDFAGDMEARGTEPLWAIKIGAKQIILQRPDQPDLVAANPGVALAGGKGTWTTKAGTEGLKVTLALEACSDGMSDLKYLYSAQVVLGDQTLKGCGGKTGAMPKE